MSTLVLAPAVSMQGNAIRYGAITLSLLLHGLLFASFGGAPATSSQQPTESITHLSFLTPASNAVAAPDVQPEKPITKLKPEPKPEDKIATKKTFGIATEPVRKVAQQQASEPLAVAAQQPAAASAVIPQIDEGLIKRETERYLTEVMAHIEQHKWYPKAARRRGIEGEVNVSFTLLADGTVHQLVVENGPSLLVAAARKAVEKATPMPTPPASIHCPLECQFRMRFNLKRS